MLTNTAEVKNWWSVLLFLFRLFGYLTPPYWNLKNIFARSSSCYLIILYKNIIRKKRYRFFSIIDFRASLQDPTISESIVAPEVRVLHGHHIVITACRKLKITLLYKGVMFVVTFMAIGRLVLEVQRTTRIKTAWRSHKPATSLPFWKWVLVGHGIMRWTDNKRPYIGILFIRLLQSKIAVLQCATTELVFTKDPNVADNV